MKWKKFMKLLSKCIKSVEMVTTKLVVMIKMIFKRIQYIVLFIFPT